MNPAEFFKDLDSGANIRKSDWEMREKIDNGVRGKVYKKARSWI